MFAYPLDSLLNFKPLNLKLRSSNNNSPQRQFNRLNKLNQPLIQFSLQHHRYPRSPMVRRIQVYLKEDLLRITVQLQLLKVRNKMLNPQKHSLHLHLSQPNHQHHNQYKNHQANR